MANEKKKRINLPRQDWNPHKVISTLYRVWLVVFAGLKVVLGALATVLLIGVICGFVFVGTLGDYLQEDILPAANTDMEGYNLDLILSFINISAIPITPSPICLYFDTLTFCISSG